MIVYLVDLLFEVALSQKLNYKKIDHRKIY